MGFLPKRRVFSGLPGGGRFWGVVGKPLFKAVLETADVFNGVISAGRVRFRVLIRYGCNDFDFLRRLNLFFVLSQSTVEIEVFGGGLFDIRVFRSGFGGEKPFATGDLVEYFRGQNKQIVSETTQVYPMNGKSEIAHPSYFFCGSFRGEESLAVRKSFVKGFLRKSRI